MVSGLSGAVRTTRKAAEALLPNFILQPGDFLLGLLDVRPELRVANFRLLEGLQSRLPTNFHNCAGIAVGIFHRRTKMDPLQCRLFRFAQIGSLKLLQAVLGKEDAVLLGSFADADIPCQFLARRRSAETAIEPG